MNPDVKTKTNIKQAVPFFAVSSMENSFRFYVDGLGCHSYGKNIEEAVANLKQVAEMCIAEEQQTSSNQFIGVREMELTINASA